ncbi:hypothetical protein SK069_10905 [Patulibacter brassicae]|uniref:Uncharacterized protein n=1 Tax=Patulibacter brassicae TaxID=1705717 RepID=A0ABU4VLX7_9ACTN|nr:hypothetical protein [Patulibacter brassicae]MDX8152104.1 hypothetical protein [Patulibacter brassicae]
MTTQTGTLVRSDLIPCEPRTITVRLDPTVAVRRLRPAAGQTLGEEGIGPARPRPGSTTAWRVAEAHVADGTATWRLEPVQPGCDAMREGAYGWYLEALWDARRYRLRVGAAGLTELAGMRLSARRVTRYPFVRRALGKPSSLRVGRRVGCTATWNRIGLRIEFANFGGGVQRGCRFGYPQSAVVTKPSLWAVQASGAPAILSTTSIRGLRDAVRVTPSRGRWRLAAAYSPIFQSFIDIVSGRARSVDAPFDRFDVWIGHAGE